MLKFLPAAFLLGFLLPLMNAALLPSAFRITWNREQIVVEYTGPAEHALYLALDHTGDFTGSSVSPFAADYEGSTTFYALKAQRLYGAKGSQRWQRTWRGTKWSDRAPAGEELKVSREDDRTRLVLSTRALSGESKVGLVVWAKDLKANGGWGWLVAASSPSVQPGEGDRYIPHYVQLDLNAPLSQLQVLSRYNAAERRIRIYQCLPRLFGNRNETRKANGTLAENGVGKFSDFNDRSLGAIADMGFTHLWLTGVLQQATATSHPGLPADDADLLKGLAGSPYAIKDYFDVCPDYADDPAKRLEEFQAAVRRARAKGLRVIIDFVPNHVARSYASDVKPEHDFGAKGRGGQGDDRTQFFLRDNNFYYLRPTDPGPGAPLRLPTYDPVRKVPLSPTCKVPGIEADGLFPGEMDHGKVTGNNVVSWTPSLDTWYETIKLNYGFDFTDPTRQRREYPQGDSPQAPVPDTWKKMDAVLAYWQSLGVDGFRCDMAHMIPPEFWHYAIARARQRQPDVYFAAEAYNDDPAKVPGGDPLLEQLAGGNGNVMFNLLNAGFNAVYDDPSYKVLKRIYEQGAWANDLDRSLPDDFISQNSLRYAENHDEVRLAAPREWGGVGLDVGRPVSAILYGLTRGPVMLYSGQEVGEPAAGVEGFGGDDSRTTIFDYWSMPEFTKWVNGGAFDGGKLSEAQKSLRDFYRRLVNLVGEPAFRDGGLWLLNAANSQSRNFGRTEGDPSSGHWMHAYLRYDQESRQRFLVVANLHRSATFKDVQVVLPKEALAWLGLPAGTEAEQRKRLNFTDKLAASGGIGGSVARGEAAAAGLNLSALPPLSAVYLLLSE